eukprot:1641067-Pyramimonas_sp.AAC.1
MEHDEKPLPVDIRTLGALAEKCRAYAKALHYKETEFQQQPVSARSKVSASGWMVGWLEEFVCCSPRVIASGKDPTRTLKGPSRGPDDHSIMRHRRAVSAGARRIRLP